MDLNVDFSKLASDAFLSAVKSDLTKISTIYVAACVDAGSDEARLAAAAEAFRRGLASNRAILECGRQILQNG